MYEELDRLTFKYHLEVSIKNLYNDISNINSNMEQNIQRIYKLEKENSSKDIRINKLEKENKDLKEEIVVLKEEIVVLKEEIVVLKKNNTDLKTNKYIKTLTTSLQDLNAEDRLENLMFTNNKKDIASFYKTLRNHRVENNHYIDKDYDTSDVKLYKKQLLYDKLVNMNNDVKEHFEKYYSKTFIPVTINYLQKFQNIKVNITDLEKCLIDMWWNS